MGGVMQFIFTINDAQVDRFGGSAHDDQSVKTSKLELGGKEAARLRITDRPGIGRAGIYVNAALSGDGSTGDHAGHNRQNVMRGKCIGDGMAFHAGCNRHPWHSRPCKCGKKIRAVVQPGICRWLNQDAIILPV